MKYVEKIIHLNKWLKFLSGSILCALVIVIILFSDAEISLAMKKLLIVLAIPGALALIGLLEIVTGTPFMDISDKWDSLRGWQRGVLGILVVIVVFMIMAFGVVLFG